MNCLSCFIQAGRSSGSEYQSVIFRNHVVLGMPIEQEATL